MLAFLKTESPDILMMQEVFNAHDPGLERRFRSLDLLKDQLGYEYVDFAPAMNRVMPEGTVTEGAAIMSRYPITSAGLAYLSASQFGEYIEKRENNPIYPRVLQRATVETPAGEVNVFNIHGVWDMDGDRYSQPRRMMADVILREIKGRPNVILAGDTNARPTNRAMQRVAEQLQPVFAVGELASTFNMKHKSDSGYASSVVDLMFISPELTVLEKACPQVDVSDHLPLVARLAL